MRTRLAIALLLAPLAAHAAASVATYEAIRGRASKTVRVQGYDSAVASGTYVLIHPLSTTAVQFLTTADELIVAAGGNANDATAGTGCREITFCGLNDSWAEVCEAEATAGASASTKTTAKFFRLHYAYCSSSGTAHAANTAAISITTEGAVAIASIEAGLGRTRQALYTVPDGWTAYLRAVRVSVDAGTSEADLRVLSAGDQSDVTAPVASPQIVDQLVDVSGSVERVYEVLPELTEKSDVWVEASGAGGASEVAVLLELLLVQDAQ